MKKPNSHDHFALEELDAFHAESLDATSKLHLETCTLCQALVSDDEALIRSIEQLPSFAPREGFAERVMARVDVKMERRRVPILSFPRLSARGQRIAGGLAALLVISVGWAFVNQGLLTEWLISTTQEASLFGEDVGTRVLGLITTLPWVRAFRIDWGSPLGGAVMAVAAIGYLSAMVAFRRLVFSNDSVGRGRP